MLEQAFLYYFNTFEIKEIAVITAMAIAIPFINLAVSPKTVTQVEL